MGIYWTVIVKNTDSTASIIISDLGQPVPPSDQVNLSEQFTYSEISGSDDLRDLVENSILVVNDGSSDLNPSNGVRWITSQNIKDLEDNYYNKTEIDNLVSGNTLDEAYNAGRVIDATVGAVKIDRGSSDSASFEIVPKVTLPTTGLAGGQIDNKNGILCIYDGTRSKWLSIARPTIAFGKLKTIRRQFLGFYGSQFPSNNSGIRMARDATIVSLSGQFDTVGTGIFELLKNDTGSVISSLSINAALGNSDMTINVNVSAGDFLQCRMNSTGTGVQDPFIFIEFAWRP